MLHLIKTAVNIALSDTRLTYEKQLFGRCIQ